METQKLNPGALPFFPYLRRHIPVYALPLILTLPTPPPLQHPLQQDFQIFVEDGGHEISKEEKRSLKKSSRSFRRKMRRPKIGTSFTSLDGCAWKPKMEIDTNISTLMIKNIPNRLRRIDLVSVLDRHCQRENSQAEANSAYDFLYLPIDFHTGSNLGYAFVNFTNNVGALKFHTALQNWQWGFYNSKKTCEIFPAKIQGLEALKNRFSNSKFKCDSEQYLPVIFDPPRDGVSVSASLVLGRCVGCSSIYEKK